MGLPDNQANDQRSEHSAEHALNQMTQELQNLQRNVIGQLSQDVDRLQTEKSRLLNDIERLRDQRQVLESQESTLLSQRQLAQQQVWAKQLAQAMAVHLHAALMQRLSQTVEPYPSSPVKLPAADGTIAPDAAYKMLASLDTTVSRTLGSLRHDLTSYHSHLTQQLSRMQTLEQQGEAILEALVNRLSQQLQSEIAQTPQPDLTAAPPEPPSAPPEEVMRAIADAAAVRWSEPGTSPSPPPPAPYTEPPRPSYSPEAERPLETRRLSRTASRQGWGKLVGLLGVAAVVLLALYLGISLWRAIASGLAQIPWFAQAPINIGSALLLLLLFVAALFSYNRLVGGARTKGISSLLPTAPASAPEAPVAPPVRTALQPRPASQFQVGLAMILLSTVVLSLHNVVVGLIGNQSSLFGRYLIGGYLSLNTLGNSMLILWMRMLIVVPLMIGLARLLYPAAWSDIRAVLSSKDRGDRSMLRIVIGSGFFLFLSQVLIYISIGQVGPGVAVTILFMYPVVTVPLAGFLFKERPTPLRIGVMGMILIGAILTALPKLSTPVSDSTNVPLGVTTAVFSGIAFAFYLISMQISFGRRLHPVPVSMLQFTTIFVLASLSLIFLPIGVEVQPQDRGGLLVSGVILGTLTLVGYLLNNFGVRFMGAAMTSIIASSGPALTALLAFLIIPGDRTALKFVQILGILIVTLGVGALSFEKFFLNKPPKTAPQRV
jgi:drug/metabolite transporter (DMT)-like permease